MIKVQAIAKSCIHQQLQSIHILLWRFAEPNCFFSPGKMNFHLSLLIEYIIMRSNYVHSHWKIEVWLVTWFSLWLFVALTKSSGIRLQRDLVYQIVLEGVEPWQRQLATLQTREPESMSWGFTGKQMFYSLWLSISTHILCVCVCVCVCVDSARVMEEEKNTVHHKQPMPSVLPPPTGVQ